MIYLASPYSHPDPVVREQRFRFACQATAALLRDGAVVFSPIVHGHPLVAFGLPTTWEYWQYLDRAYLERSDEVVVLIVEGWQTSPGVRAEIGIARERGKPVRFLGVEDSHSPTTLTHAGSEVQA